MILMWQKFQSKSAATRRDEGRGGWVVQNIARHSCLVCRQSSQIRTTSGESRGRRPNEKVRKSVLKDEQQQPNTAAIPRLPALKYQHPILHLKAVRAPLRFSVGDDPRMNANCCPTYVCAVACTVSRSNETSSLLDGYVRTTITIILKLRMGEDEERSREHRSTFFSCILLILLPTIA